MTAADPRTLTEFWSAIDALGQQVDAGLDAAGVDLWMGGEPTFVSAEDPEAPEWQVAALGDRKRELGWTLLECLSVRLGLAGPLLIGSYGKQYPGEPIPRWALGCYWREDGEPLLPPGPANARAATAADAQIALQALARQLGVDPQSCLPAREPGVETVAGWVLPLLATEAGWASCAWEIPQPLALLPGSSPVGLRLPLGSLPEAEWQLETDAGLVNPSVPVPAAPLQVAPNSIRLAVTAEVRDGELRLLLPPFGSARAYADLLAAIAAVAHELNLAIGLDGYPPPGGQGIRGFQITPDPGVLEVNIHPARNWPELCHLNRLLYEEAAACGLCAHKFSFEGFRLDTGGGAHVTLGGPSLDQSPVLRRPDLLVSLLRFWQHHPSLSYLFSGPFVGPTSQSPRVDEGRHDSLYELELVFACLPPGEPVPAWLVDRLLRNLLIDTSGNTHRAEFCIDKLFPIENPRLQIGLLELRAIAMPETAELRLLQCLLIRACVAWFWRQPYTEPLRPLGTALHDRYLRPSVLRADFAAVLDALAQAGYPFDPQWFEPFFTHRFPELGRVDLNGSGGEPLTLVLLRAIEPWHALGENNGSSRPVDASMERIEVALEGDAAQRYAITVNGYQLPLDGDRPRVGAVRFRARTQPDMFHPTLLSQSPLEVRLLDPEAQRDLGGVRYFSGQPEGQLYPGLPTDQAEATRRCRERFQALGAGDYRPGERLPVSGDLPDSLDLRWAGVLPKAAIQ